MYMSVGKLSRVVAITLRLGCIFNAALNTLNRLIEMESQQITWPLLAPIRPPILSPTI